MSNSSSPTANNSTNNITITPFRYLGWCRHPCSSTGPNDDSKMIAKAGKKEAVLEDVSTALKRSAKAINFGGWEEKAGAAAEITRLARADGRTRRRLGELGVVQPLVAMVIEAEEVWFRRMAVDALVELAKGSFRNKKLIVEAGLLSNLPHLIQNQQLVKEQHFTHLLFSLSSLAKTHFPIQSHHFLPFLIKILNAEETNHQHKLTIISTLHNLSTKLDNIKSIVASGAVHPLLTLSADKRASEGALAILANLAASAMGKKAIEDDDPLVLDVLVEILAWEDKPRSQEFATYLLMVIAHRSSAVWRQKMLRMGIVAVLVKVALLGSAVARKRAFELLPWFNGGKKCGSTGPMEEEEIEEGKKDVKTMVKQSLNRNMELLMRRANGIDSSSCKSLLY